MKKAPGNVSDRSRGLVLSVGSVIQMKIRPAPSIFGQHVDEIVVFHIVGFLCSQILITDFHLCGVDNFRIRTECLRIIVFGGKPVGGRFFCRNDFFDYFFDPRFQFIQTGRGIVSMILGYLKILRNIKGYTL